MNKNNDTKRRNALLKLQENMKTAKLENSFIRAGENASPIDILACDFSGIEGQFFFPDIKSAENVFYFSCMMVIDKNVTERDAVKMKAGIAQINLDLLCGTLALYPDMGLVYKLTFPIPESIGEDALFETMDIAAAHAMFHSSRIAQSLIAEK
ncbi:MAG: hypothetical protein K5655_07770 [Lachnospiraceae bacterium]|nr:hypothetical protein [Lachnospiraceae bacterium]